MAVDKNHLYLEQRIISTTTGFTLMVKPCSFIALKYARGRVAHLLYITEKDRCVIMVVWLGISLEYLNTRRSGYILNNQNFGAFKRHYLIKQIMAKILKKAG